MNLSKLTLNPQSRQVQAELSNPYEMHRTLFSVLPSELIKGNERLLYRLETSHTPPYLVILFQSHLAPDWSALEQKGYLLRPAQIKTFDPRFQTGQVLAFRLAANPTKRLKSPNEGTPGKRVGLHCPEDQQEWLLRKAGQNGFSILSMQVTSLADQFAYKGKNEKRMKVTHHGVRFDGILQVVDSRLLTLALMNGIGSAKGFGFGLLSLARA
jgi:CRISPR system Cascade subunit CasE